MLSELYIDGGWCHPDDGETLAVHNPASGDILHRVAAAGPKDVDRAVQAARRALPGWQRAGGRARARFLKSISAAITARAEELARLSSLNNGKPLSEARIDMADAATSFAYYSDLAGELDDGQDAAVAVPDADYKVRLRREALGVAGLIVPWNFPLVTTSWKTAPALAAGCTVVLKPSEVTPVVELELARIADAVGLPAGVLNIVTGTGPRVGAPLTTHPGIAKISFTGSNGVGERVMAAAAQGPKSVSLELGGKSPIIVFDDADLELAAELVAQGIFMNAGQMCSATSRLLVQRRIAPQLIERVVAHARALRAGDPLDEATTLGPVTTKDQYDKVMGYAARGRADGLKLLTGGGRPKGIERGWFVEPTIFAEVPVDSPLWREEIFGPILCARSFKREEDAIALANDSAFGLVATIVTSDPERADRVANAVEVGHVWINSPQMIFIETSWGGFKASGIGRELGPWGLSSYLGIKHKTERLVRTSASGERAQ